MGDQPEQTMAQIKVNITWPPDTYLDALPANVFVFNDLGENMCLAFGFVPPPPRVEKLVQDGDLNIEAKRIQALLIPKSLAIGMARELRKYIHNNPRIFDGQRVDDDDSSTSRK
jgi:hypothetical protein